jgi:hypothetical protein
MDLKTVARGAPWMTRDERLATRRLLRRFRPILERRSVPDSPFLALRLAELAAASAIALRMQGALAPPAPTPEDPCPAPPPPAPALAEAIGKAHDRLRKALAEVEEHIDKYGCTQGSGLADLLRPMIKQWEAAGGRWPAPVDDPNDPGRPIDPMNPRRIPPHWETGTPSTDDAPPPEPEPEPGPAAPPAPDAARDGHPPPDDTDPPKAPPLEALPSAAPAPAAPEVPPPRYPIIHTFATGFGQRRFRPAWAG